MHGNWGNPMNLYKKNLQFIRQTNSKLYSLVTNSQPVHAAETTIFIKENNALIKTECGQCFLHSLYDRKRELAKLFEKVQANPQAIVLFGVGMGDAVLHINKRFSGLEHLIIVEPNLDVFKAFLSKLDLSHLLKNCPKITIILNFSTEETGNSLHQIIDQDLFQSISFIASLSYRTLYRSYYQSVIEFSRKAVRRKMINLSTRSVTSYKWVINEWRNHKKTHVELERVMERISAPPVIIVSAGPSLNKNIHLLSEAKSRALIIAVGSAMTILDRHGIVPHFRMAFDGNQANRNLFAAIDTASCPLICSNALYYEVLPEYKGKTIQMILNTDYLSQYFRRKQHKACKLIRSGHSIANVAFDLACNWGSKKIILIGQDLCYTNEKMHADGAWDDNLALAETARKNWLLAKDIYGEDAYTDQPFLGMKAIFEELILLHPEVQCINASEGGLPIAGTQNRTLRQVLEEDLPQSLNLSALIDESLSSALPEEEYAGNLLSVVKLAELELKEISTINQMQIELLNEAQSMLERKIFSKKIIKRLKKFEAIAEKLSRIDYYSYVICPHLSDTYQVLSRRFNYTGNDENRQLEAMLKLFAGKAAALKAIVRLSDDLVQEYLGKKVLNVTYQ